MLHPGYAHCATTFLDQLRHFCTHPTLERWKRLRLAEKGCQEHWLRHPDGVGILRRNLLERELRDLLAIDADFAGIDQGVGLGKHVVQEPQFVQQVGGAWLQYLSTKFTVEVFVPFQDQDVDTSLREQEAKHHASRSSTDNTNADANAVHDSSPFFNLRPGYSPRTTSLLSAGHL